MNIKYSYFPTGKNYNLTLGLLPNYSKQASFIKTFINGYNYKPIKILDVGCGTGRLINTISKETRNIEIVGVDISRKMINEASSYCGYQVKLICRDILKYLKNGENSFDIVLVLFSFIQRFRTFKSLQEFLGLISAALFPGGIVIADWHVKENLRKKFPINSVTSLIRRHDDKLGWTLIDIESKSWTRFRELTCKFKIHRGTENQKSIVTKHRLLELSQNNIRALSLRSNLNIQNSYDNFSKYKSNLKKAWRAVTIMSRSWLIDRIAASLVVEFDKKNIGVINICPIGSSARHINIETDKDLLLILEEDSLKNQYWIIKDCCERIAKSYRIRVCEFRQGPFKQEFKEQLHFIIHSPSTIKRIPITTRLTWSYSGGLSIDNKSIFSRFPSRKDILRSAIYNNEKMTNDIKRGRLRYREWIFNDGMQLKTKVLSSIPIEFLNGVYRYHIRASLSDLSLLMKKDPYSDNSYSKILSRRALQVVKKAFNTQGKLKPQDIGFFLSEIRKKLRLIRDSCG